MKQSHTLRARWIALLGAGILAAGVVFLATSPAIAHPGEGGFGTLTVHKLEQPNGDYGPADGSDLGTLTDAVPLEATFRVCKIDGIDLSETDDWYRLENLTATPAEVPGEPPVVREVSGTGDEASSQVLEISDCKTQSTAAAGDKPLGETTFELDADLAYVVWESVLPKNAIGAGLPTIVTIPYPSNGARIDDDPPPAWNYNVHIYPKNTLAGSDATKSGEVIGNQVTFTIAVPIKPMANGMKYTELKVEDTLSSFLTYTGASVSLTDGSDPAQSVTLTPVTDYTLTLSAGSGGDTVVLEFLAPGLNKINPEIDADNKATGGAYGGTLTLTITATATGSGSTKNEAKITINGTSTGDTEGPSVPEDKVEDIYEGARILKWAKNKNVTDKTGYLPLEDAEFDVYAVAKELTECPGTPPAVERRVIAGAVSKINADDQPRVAGTPKEVLAKGQYCVYETVTPAGYKTSAPVLWVIADDNATVDVVNVQIGSESGDLPHLPFTGSTGSLLLVGGGAALLLLGGVLMYARRRKEALNA